MKVFAPLYEKVIRWSRHNKAPYYLSTVSFVESSVFPIPPDIMLISMSLAAPQNAWGYALLATLFSTLGGAFGYLIGYYALHALAPWLLHSSYAAAYLSAQTAFRTWGVWFVILAGFTPIPYKLFTLGAGALHMPFFSFMLASLIGRGARFFLVAGILHSFGTRLHGILLRYIERLGWLLVIMAGLGIVLWKI